MEERTVIVTGASRGLGRAVANAAAQRGLDVIGVGTNSKLTDTSDFNFVECDLTDADQVTAAWEQLANYGLSARPLIVNNAGTYLSGSVLNSEVTEIEDVWRRNYLGPAYFTRVCLDFVREADFANVLSTSVLETKATNSVYGSAKAGLLHFFRSLAKEFDDGRYRFFNLIPGNINTWSEEPQAGAIDPKDLANYILDTVLAETTLWVSEAVVVPAELD